MLLDLKAVRARRGGWSASLERRVKAVSKSKFVMIYAAPGRGRSRIEIAELGADGGSLDG